MDNKGPVLISILSQIILLIILLQVSGFLKGLTILVMLCASALMMLALKKKTDWSIGNWYVFVIIIILWIFIILSLLFRSNVTDFTFILVIAAYILGFFIVAHGRERRKEMVEEDGYIEKELDVPEVSIVDLEKQIAEKKEAQKRTVARKPVKKRIVRKAAVMKTVAKKAAVKKKPIRKKAVKKKVAKKKPAKKIIKKKPVKTISVKKNIAKKQIVVSANGSLKFHNPDCGYVKTTPANKLRTYVSRGQAEAMGLDACDLCIK